MARCDEGYACRVCGQDVEAITESDLYLRYVLGEVPLEVLHLQPECHIACNPALAQYIIDADYEAVFCDGPFGKIAFDSDYVHSEEIRVSRGWRRLQAIPMMGLGIIEYPLSVTPEVER